MTDRLGQDWPWVFAGIGIGVFNVLFLKFTLDRFALRAGDRSLLWLGLGMVVRLALVAGILFLAVHRSLIAAVFAFMGFWMVRWPLLLWLNKRSERQ